MGVVNRYQKEGEICEEAIGIGVFVGRVNNAN